MDAAEGIDRNTRVRSLATAVEAMAWRVEASSIHWGFCTAYGPGEEADHYARARARQLGALRRLITALAREAMT